MTGHNDQPNAAQDLEQIFDVVTAHHDQVTAVGLILYTDEHPHIKRVLRDTDYWAALDAMSGPKWTILSARAEVGHCVDPETRPEGYSLLRRLWHEPKENKQLLQLFSLDTTQDLPLFFVFSYLGDGRLLQSKTRLDDSSEQRAFDRLKYVIKSLTEAVTRIDPENRGNREAVFHALDQAIFDIKVMDTLKMTFKFHRWLRDRLS